MLRYGKQREAMRVRSHFRSSAHPHPHPHPKSQYYQNLVSRRDMLRHLVNKQIVIAKDLAASEGKYSRDTMWAWDVVEELSCKLHMVEVSMIQMRMEPLRYRDADVYDFELSLREYDV